MDLTATAPPTSGGGTGPPRDAAVTLGTPYRWPSWRPAVTREPSVYTAEPTAKCLRSKLHYQVTTDPA
jgi:hypothetical protein